MLSPSLSFVSTAPVASERATHLDDGELVSVCLTGENVAKGELVRRYVGHVRSVIYRMVQNESDAQDLVQETFIRAFHSLANVRDPSRLKGWMCRVARFTALDHLRRRRRNVWLEYHPPEQLDSAGASEEAISIRVTHVLQMMTEEDRATLILRFISGLEQPELAEALGCSLATAKRRLRRARTRFELLAGQDEMLREHVSSSRPLP